MRLDSQRPERLVNELDTESLIEAVLAIDQWSERRLGAVDYVLSHWTAQMAARQDARSVAELQSVIGQILERRPPPDPYAHRWRALDDALEARRLTLATRDPERVMGMRHVLPILEHLRKEGPTRQGDLLGRLRLGVSVSRLSQIVKVMEANGLVEVEQRGRESFLRLPETMGLEAKGPDPRSAVPTPIEGPPQRTYRTFLRQTA